MKRHPKRARPLWGAAKRHPVTRPEPRRILYFEVSGRDAQGVMHSERLTPAPDGSPVTTVGSYRSDVRMVAVLEPRIPKRTPITIGFSDGPLPPRPGVLTFTTDGTTPIHESGPRVSADGMTAGSIGARAVGRAFADGIAAGIALSHGGPLVALAVEQVRESEEADARRRVLESQLGVAVGALRDEADMRRALAGGAFPLPLTQGDPRP